MAFNFNPVNGLLDINTFPTNPGSETEARQQFMELFNQLKEYMNTVQGFKLTADNGLSKANPSNNVNNFLEDGKYYINQMEHANCPFSYTLLTIRRANQLSIIQEGESMGGAARATRRSNDGGAHWSDWAYEDSSLGASGYQKLPSGLIIQWGDVNINITPGSTSPTNVTFPIAFPVNMFGVFVSPFTGFPSSYFTSAESYTRAGFVLRGTGPEVATLTVKWFSIGY